MITPNAQTFTTLHNHRSPARMSTYLTAAEGNADLAEQIYEWNWELTAAFLQVIGRLEVKLRNAFDQSISQNRAAHPHWTADQNGPVTHQSPGQLGVLNKHSRGQIAAVVGRLHQLHPTRSTTSGDVIGNLSFGFWRALPVKAREKNLWVPYLHHGFTPGTSRSEVEDLLKVAHVMRNRCAHHEPVFARPLTQDYSKLIRLAVLLGADVHEHIEAQSWIPMILAAAPLQLQELRRVPRQARTAELVIG